MLQLRDYGSKLLKLKKSQKIDFEDAEVFISNSFENRYDTYIKYVLSFARKDGIWLEFGVSTGQTTKKYVEFMEDFQKPLYGFDSFMGLPEKWAHHDIGKFSTNGVVPEIDGTEIAIGLFEETLPIFVKDHPTSTKISVLIIDCDLYSSTKTIFDFLSEYLTVGTIVIFDEIHNGSGIYKDWKKHEYKALMELAANRNISYKWIAFEKFGEQASIVITAI